MGGGGYTVRTYLDVNVEAHIMDEMLDDVVEMRVMDDLHTHTHTHTYTHTHTDRERERERERKNPFASKMESRQPKTWKTVV